MPSEVWGGIIYHFQNFNGRLECWSLGMDKYGRMEGRYST